MIRPTRRAATDAGFARRRFARLAVLGLAADDPVLRALVTALTPGAVLPPRPSSCSTTSCC